VKGTGARKEVNEFSDILAVVRDTLL